MLHKWLNKTLMLTERWTALGSAEPTLWFCLLTEARTSPFSFAGVFCLRRCTNRVIRLLVYLFVRLLVYVSTYLYSCWEKFGWGFQSERFSMKMWLGLPRSLSQRLQPWVLNWRRGAFVGDPEGSFLLSDLFQQTNNNLNDGGVFLEADLRRDETFRLRRRSRSISENR